MAMCNYAMMLHNNYLTNIVVHIDLVIGGEIKPSRLGKWSELKHLIGRISNIIGVKLSRAITTMLLLLTDK